MKRKTAQSRKMLIFLAISIVILFVLFLAATVIGIFVFLDLSGRVEDTKTEINHALSTPTTTIGRNSVTFYRSPEYRYETTETRWIDGGETTQENAVDS